MVHACLSHLLSITLLAGVNMRSGGAQRSQRCSDMPILAPAREEIPRHTCSRAVTGCVEMKKDGEDR